MINKLFCQTITKLLLHPVELVDFGPESRKRRTVPGYILVFNPESVIYLAFYHNLKCNTRLTIYLTIHSSVPSCRRTPAKKFIAARTFRDRENSQPANRCAAPLARPSRSFAFILALSRSRESTQRLRARVARD